MFNPYTRSETVFFFLAIYYTFTGVFFLAISVLFFENNDYRHPQESENMPGCAGRRGTGLATSSRRSNVESDTVFRAALITGIRRLGNYLGFEVPDKNPKCDCLRRVYKKCLITSGFNCGFYAEELTKTCPGFSDGEFLRALRSSNQKLDSERKKNDGV